MGLNLVKKHEADAFVSSGSTGAVLVGGQVLVGRSKGVERPPLAPLIPTMEGVSLLIDCGAMWTPDHLIWFSLQKWVQSIWSRLWESKTPE